MLLKLRLQISNLKGCKFKLTKKSPSHIKTFLPVYNKTNNKWWLSNNYVITRKSNTDNKFSACAFIHLKISEIIIKADSDHIIVL